MSTHEGTIAIKSFGRNASAAGQTIPGKYTNIEASLVNWLHQYQPVLARLALFVVYVWFGTLKLLGLSPANPLVRSLQAKTLPFLSFDQFILLFALFEVLIGILLLIPKATRVAIGLFVAHMITTTMPLLLLPEMTWQKALVPTMEGQYIIKNVVLIALATNVAVNMKRGMRHSTPATAARNREREAARQMRYSTSL